MRRPVRGDGADVAPVALHRIGARQPLLRLRRQQLVAQVLEPVLARLVRERLQPVQRRSRGEHEDLVRGRRRRRLVRLVGVVVDLPALADPHDPVAGGVVLGDLRGHHRHLGAGAEMCLDDLAVVQLVDGVGADDDQRLGIEVPHQVGLAPQRVGRPRGPAAPVGAEERRQGHQPTGGAVQVPGAAVGQVLRERRRVELHRHPYVGDLRVLAVAQREVDQPVDAGEGHRRLGAVLGEQFQPAAGTTGEDEDEDPGKGHVGCAYPVAGT